MMQVPAGGVNVTSPVVGLTVHPDVDVLSTPYVTGLPEPPPVAVTVYVVPGNGFVGGVFVKVMVCGDIAMFPLSTTVAGAASAELTLALFANEPAAAGVIDTDMGGSVVPIAMGSVLL
jgi:hypothetical protein